MSVHLSLAFLLSFMALQANAQGKIGVTITNIKNDKGVCRTCLFNSEAAFSGESGKPVQCLLLAIKNKTTHGTFENIAAGNYAVMVFHDENNNNKLDKNFLGIPKEGYGASNNRLPFAGAPSFKDNRFIVKDGAGINISIKLRNL
jgi:uncharacterized protein (DUF2141 family)